MVVEVMGVRLMAPWFGQSQLVWTHVIGVVLASLAAGQWLGGRWAESGRGPGPGTLLLASAGWSLALPDVVAWLSKAVLPKDLPLLDAYPFVTMGSLLVSIVGLGLPMAALGAVTPWLVRLSRDAGQAPARVTGRILAAGTLGSLAGTFGATHVLLPALGSAGAVRAAGGLLVVAGVALLCLSRRKPSLASLLLLIGLPLVANAAPETEPHPGLLEELETPYQWARVIEQPDGTRQLLLNEGLDSFHSVWQPTGVLTGLYYDAMLYGAAVSPRAEDAQRHVLVVGLAAGTLARQISMIDPKAIVRGVELDEDIVALGQRWFELPEKTLIDAGYDGRVVLDRVPDAYGAILIDAYAQQIYLPPHLCSVEFFEVVRQRLLPGGVAVLNIGGLSVEDPVVAAVSETFAEVFPGAIQGRMPGSRNMIVMGWKGEQPTHEVAADALTHWNLRPALDWMLDDQQMTPIEKTGARLLRDGNAPVEALAHASWRGEWSETQATLEGTSGQPSLDLQRGRELLGATRWSKAEQQLQAVVTSGSPEHIAEAMFLLGNLAFLRERPALAKSRYEELLQVEPALLSEGLRQAALANLALLDEQLAHVDRLSQQEGLLGSWTWAAGVVFLSALVLAGFHSAPRR
ncbi:MAG: spermidine synthase [Pseudohongiellaceae bacterium]|jgi:spermidine synthase